MFKTKLKIDGMMCEMCEKHVNDEICKAFNVKKVTSSCSTGETVIISQERIPDDKIRCVINETGYIILEVQCEECSDTIE